MPLLSRIVRGGAYRTLAPGAVQVQWQCVGAGTLALAVNLRAAPTAGYAWAGGHLLWQEGEAIGDDALGPWSVRCWLSEQ